MRKRKAQMCQKQELVGVDDGSMSEDKMDQQGSLSGG